MFDWLYSALGTLLYWFSSIMGGSYAFALLLYALMFKLIFLPFTIKQQKNQIKMAKLQPKIALIRAKYKGRTDRPSLQKQQEEILQLQQQEGYNPLSGCLPLLIQLPIILLLYKVIRTPLTYICKLTKENVIAIYTALNGEEKAFGSIDQIKLISQIQENGLNVLDYGADRLLPNFRLFGLNLANDPSLTNFSLLVLIPVIAAALQWFTMWVTRKVNGNAAQTQLQDEQTAMSMKMMDLVMPLMTLFIAFNFSGMLGLYWIYQSVLAIIQTLILSAAMPIPRFTEEELKAMKKAQKEAEKAQKAALKEQPKYRSLHYIDEDDYDELPEIKTKNKDSQKKGISQNAPEIKD